MSGDAPAKRLCFVLVHGARLIDRIIGWWSYLTCRRPTRWFDADSPLSQEVSKAFPDARIVRFSWSGAMSHRARYTAAGRLETLLAELLAACDDVVVIAHSHGGNVALMSLAMLRTAHVHLVTLGTPFIQVRKERSVQRIGILFVLLYSFPLFLAAGAFVYFASLSKAPDAFANAVISAVSLLALTILFYLLLTKFNIHERIEARLKTLETAIRASCHGTVLRHPLKLYVVYDGADEVLGVSSLVRKIAARLRARSTRDHETMGTLFRWWNPLYFGLCFLVLVIVFSVNLYLVGSLSIMYGLAALVAIFVVYLCLGLLLIARPIFSIFANEAVKFKLAGLGFNSFSPLENLLISVQSRRTPVVHDPAATVSVLRHAASGAGRLRHTFICRDPVICAVIPRWVETVVIRQAPWR